MILILRVITTLLLSLVLVSCSSSSTDEKDGGQVLSDTDAQDPSNNPSQGTDTEKEMELRLIGDSELSLELGTEYQEQGVSARIGGEDASESVSIIGKVNVDVLGIYALSYNLIDQSSGKSLVVNRNVEITKANILETHSVEVSFGTELLQALTIPHNITVRTGITSEVLNQSLLVEVPVSKTEDTGSMLFLIDETSGELIAPAYISREQILSGNVAVDENSITNALLYYLLKARYPALNTQDVLNSAQETLAIKNLNGLILSYLTENPLDLLSSAGGLINEQNPSANIVYLAQQLLGETLASTYASSLRSATYFGTNNPLVFKREDPSFNHPYTDEIKYSQLTISNPTHIFYDLISDNAQVGSTLISPKSSSIELVLDWPPISRTNPAQTRLNAPQAIWVNQYKSEFGISSLAGVANWFKASCLTLNLALPIEVCPFSDRTIANYLNKTSMTLNLGIDTSAYASIEGASTFIVQNWDQIRTLITENTNSEQLSRMLPESGTAIGRLLSVITTPYGAANSIIPFFWDWEHSPTIACELINNSDTSNTTVQINQCDHGPPIANIDIFSRTRIPGGERLEFSAGNSVDVYGSTFGLLATWDLENDGAMDYIDTSINDTVTMDYFDQSAEVYLEIKDSYGDWDTRVLELNIKTENNPPFYNGGMRTLFQAEKTETFRLQVGDVDGDLIDYELINAPSWMTLSNTYPIVTVNPTESDVGVYEDIYLHVSDRDAIERKEILAGPFTLEVETTNTCDKFDPTEHQFEYQFLSLTPLGSARVKIGDINYTAQYRIEGLYVHCIIDFMTQPHYEESVVVGDTPNSRIVTVNRNYQFQHANGPLLFFFDGNTRIIKIQTKSGVQYLLLKDNNEHTPQTYAAWHKPGICDVMFQALRIKDHPNRSRYLDNEAMDTFTGTWCNGGSHKGYYELSATTVINGQPISRDHIIYTYPTSESEEKAWVKHERCNNNEDGWQCVRIPREEI